MGDVEFELDEVDFSARWGWVPLLDFGLALVALLEDLRLERSFEFTESDDALVFSRLGDDEVEVRSTYSEGVAIVDRSELVIEVEASMRRFLVDLRADYPDITMNPVVRDWLARFRIDQ